MVSRRVCKGAGPGNEGRKCWLIRSWSAEVGQPQVYKCLLEAKDRGSPGARGTKQWGRILPSVLVGESTAMLLTRLSPAVTIEVIASRCVVRCTVSLMFSKFPSLCVLSPCTAALVEGLSGHCRGEDLTPGLERERACLVGPENLDTHHTRSVP